MTTSIAMLLFPRLTQLDLTAPFEIFSRCPSTTIDLVAATLEPVLSEGGLPIAPTKTFDASSLLLSAAGLLRGYRATSHWTAIDFLPQFGAVPVRERLVRDRNRITGAGVTAGIDLALAVAGDVFGEDVARRIQVQIEYGTDRLPALPANDGRRDAVAKAAARLA